MESFSSKKSHIFNPLPHRDPYCLDSMYISPIHEDEIWNLSSFHKAELLNFSLLALRSCVHEKLLKKSLILLGTSLLLRRSFSKKKWCMKNLPQSWNFLYPSLTDVKIDEILAFKMDLDVTLQLDWEDQGERAGFGLVSINSNEVFPKILDQLIYHNSFNGRVYLRTSRQSFLYIPSIRSVTKKVLFIQDKDSHGYPEFYYYWLGD